MAAFLLFISIADSKLWQCLIKVFCYPQNCLLFYSKTTKAEVNGEASETPSLNWMDALPPPPLSGDLDECEEEDDNELIQDMG